MAEREVGAYAWPLHFAVKENDVALVRSLVEEDSSRVSSRDEVGRTPLHWALEMGRDEAAKALILNMSRSALDARDQQGCTPLHYAAVKASVALARVLIMRGASVDAVDAVQRTPLHFAASQTSPEMVELLVSRGADRARKNAKGQLPLDVAIMWGADLSVPILKLDSTATTTGSDNESVRGITASSSGPVEAQSSVKKSPSLDKLMRSWRAAEAETRRKKEAELVAAHEANAVLEEALSAWRLAEQANNPQRPLNVVDPDSDQPSTSMPNRFRTLSVEIGGGPSSCDENDLSSMSCPIMRRDLSWCTEWEVHEDLPEEVAHAPSPRERKLTPSSPWKEGNQPWVQVPTYKQTLDPSFDNPKLLRRSNSFDGSHFIIQVRGLATKLPFMSSLEVY